MAEGSGGLEIGIGILLTLAGIGTLLMPEVPFICIGALIFGPILIAQGIAKSRRAGRATYPVGPPTYPPPYSAPYTPPPPPPAAPPAQPVPVQSDAGSALKTCGQCGRMTGAAAKFCPSCGTPFPS